MTDASKMMDLSETSIPVTQNSNTTTPIEIESNSSLLLVPPHAVSQTAPTRCIRHPPPVPPRQHPQELHEYATFQRSGRRRFSFGGCPNFHIEARWGLQIKNNLKPLATSIAISVLAVSAVNALVFVQLWQQLGKMNSEIEAKSLLVNRLESIVSAHEDTISEMKVFLEETRIAQEFQTQTERVNYEEESRIFDALVGSGENPLTKPPLESRKKDNKRSRRDSGRGNKRVCKKKKGCRSRRKNVIQEVKFRGGASEILVKNNSQTISPWVPLKGDDSSFKLSAFDNDFEKITVRQPGLYWVYVQLYYALWQEFSGFSVYVKKANSQGQARVITQCSVSGVSEHKLSEQSCFTGVAWYINAGDNIYVEQLHKNEFKRLNSSRRAKLSPRWNPDASTKHELGNETFGEYSHFADKRVFL